MAALRRVLTIALFDLRRAYAKPLALVVLVVLPALAALGLVALVGVVTGPAAPSVLVVVDEDGGSAAAAYVAALEAVPFTVRTFGRQQAADAIADGWLRFAVVVPAGFGARGTFDLEVLGRAEDLGGSSLAIAGWARAVAGRVAAGLPAAGPLSERESPRGGPIDGDAMPMRLAFGVFAIAALLVLIGRGAALQRERLQGRLARTVASGVPASEVVAAFVVALLMAGGVQALAFFGTTAAVGSSLVRGRGRAVPRDGRRDAAGGGGPRGRGHGLRPHRGAGDGLELRRSEPLGDARWGVLAARWHAGDAPADRPPQPGVLVARGAGGRVDLRGVVVAGRTARDARVDRGGRHGRGRAGAAPRRPLTRRPRAEAVAAALRWEPVFSLPGAPPSFRDAWPLHIVRYAAVGFAVMAWSQAPAATAGLPAAIGWTTVALLLDLWLHGPEGRAGGLGVALAQAAAACAAFLNAPGLPTAVVAAVVIAGNAATLPPRQRNVVTLGVAVTTGIAAAAALGVDAVLALLPAYALAHWVGVSAAAQAREALAHQRTVTELEAAQERLAALSDAGREGAVERERQRIAADVHDTLGHALMAMLVQVQVARRVLATDADGAARRLEAVESNARATLDQVRKTLRRTLDDGVQVALPTAIEHVTRDFEAASATTVDLTFVPSEADLVDVDPKVTDALLRTVREALTNAVRHGMATRIEVELEAAGPRLHLRVGDDGRGTDVTRPGMGLAAMVARIQAVGGSIRFASRAGGGFRVEVAVRRR